MQGADAVVELLESAGVTHAFGVVGTTVLSILDRMDRSDVTYVSTRHEQVSSGMAAGYTLASREPSVSISHVGPGAANQVIGIAAAFRDDVPVISITGNEPSYLLGNDVNHEWDVVGVFENFTKQSGQVTEAQFSKQVRDALVQAVTGAPGPVHIDVPLNLADTDVAPPDDRTRRLLGSRDMRGTTSRARPPASVVDRVHEFLTSAEQPVIVAGTEVRWADAADELRRLAELLEVPVVTSQSARGSFPESHDLSLGYIAHSTLDAGNDYVANADLVLGVGSRFSDLTTNEWQLFDDDATIVQASLRARELDRHYVADVSTLCDPASFCTDLADAVDGTGLSFGSVVSPAREAFERDRRATLEPGPLLTDGVDPRRVVRAVDDRLDEYAITTGGGVHNTYPRLLPVDDLQSYFGTRNFTGMSQGLPLALGAQLALDRPVVTFEGDGGFAMVMQDLETAVREEIPVKVIIFNNDAYLSHARRQEQQYGGRYVGTKYTNPAFDAVAEEFGMFGECVNEDSEVDDAVERLLDVDGPGLLDVHVDPTIDA